MTSIAYVSSAFAATDTITLPSHQAGDLIVIVAFRRTSTAVPIVPSGWKRWGAGSSGGVAVVGWQIAQSNAETSGTWTNAEGVACSVYRSTKYLVAGGILATIGSAATTTATFTEIASINLRNNANTWSIIIACYRSDTSDLDTPPTGSTNRVSGIRSDISLGLEIAIHDTNGDGVWTTQTHAINAGAKVATNWIVFVCEILETPQTVSSGSAKPSHPLFQKVIG